MPRSDPNVRLPIADCRLPLLENLMLKRLNHIAIVVPDLEAASAVYRETLGASVSAPQALPDQSSACASARLLPATSRASVAAMKASRSPSSTPCVSEVSCPVRRSFTI